MVKLNLDCLKNSKILILIFVVLVSFILEVKNDIVEISDFNNLKFHNVSAGLVETSDPGEKNINSNLLNTPRFIKAKSGR